MKKITIGMAHHTDFHGVYFTIQDILKEIHFNKRSDLLDRLEFLVIENAPDNEHAKTVKNLKSSTGLGDKFRVIDFVDSKGTSSTRNKIIEQANTEFVLVMDCHVLLCPVIKTLDKLFEHIDKYPNTKNLYQGPLIHDNLVTSSTNYNDEWGAEMWGRWGSGWSCRCKRSNFSVIQSGNFCKFVDFVSQKDIKECNYCYSLLPEELNYAGHERPLTALGFNRLCQSDEEQEFEIFAQGLGLFFTAKQHWLGFNEYSRGFGGEECYIHEKYRKHGRRAMCLPFLRWLHRFGRPDGVKYELTVDNKLRNYVLEFTELGLDLKPLYDHFIVEGKFSEEKFKGFIEESKQIYGV